MAVCHGKRYVHLVPRGMTDGSTATVLPTVARVPEAVIPYAGCSRVLPQLLYERSYAVAVILIILLHWGMMSAISTFVRLTWVWADFASVAEFDLAVSFDLETGVLWVFEVFLLSMLFLISAKEMFAVFTAETEARAPSVFAGILSLTRLDNFALSGIPGGTCEIVHMAGCFFCD